MKYDTFKVTMKIKVEDPNPKVIKVIKELCLTRILRRKFEIIEEVIVEEIDVELQDKE